MRLRAALLLSLLVLSLPPAPARAAQSYDNCTGYVDSLPAVITTQGTWCLRQDVSTALATGTAITIAANNVTLDCNDFKIGGLAAGVGTIATGIRSSSRLNNTLRNCTVRGFFRGMMFEGSGGGHLVEHNRFEGNTFVAMYLSGDNSTIRDNLVLDTGGSTSTSTLVYGIFVKGDGLRVLDNAINGLTPGAPENGNTVAIYHEAFEAEDIDIGRNWIQGLASPDAGQAIGIYVVGGRPIVYENHLHSPKAGTNHTGILCGAASGGLARANLVYGFNTTILNCTLSGNVVVAP